MDSAEENIIKLREISKHLLDPDIAAEIFEQLPDALIIVGSNGDIRLLNRQAELLFGYHRNELFDKPIEILIPNEIKDRHVDLRRNFTQNPYTRSLELAHNMPLRAVHKDGTEFNVEIILNPIMAVDDLLVVALIRRKGEAF